MECCTTTGKSRDLLSSPWLSLVVFWLLAIAIAVAGILGSVVIGEPLFGLSR